MALRVLVAHNRYLEPGGEDLAFEADARLLEGHGHVVLEFVEDNRRIEGMGRAGLAARTIWSRESRIKISDQIKKCRPDIVHFHNTFPLLSPSVYSVPGAYGIPVVQTLHNFRLMCPNGLFFRDGRVCEDCRGRFFPWPGILHACYRRSRSETSVVSAMLSIHRLLGTWAKQVDAYIALTDHERQKFIQGGLPQDKIVVRPNFPDPEPGVAEGGTKAYVLFVGRLAPEKGVEVLLAAWASLRGIPLRMIGDGPLWERASDIVRSDGLSEVKLLGHQSHSEILSALKGARFLVVPSECYETFSLVVVEALATGVPVVASRLGALGEIVDHGRTGLHFEPGNVEDLADQVRRLWASPDQSQAMGREARKEYEQRYTSESSYQKLMEIYNRLIASKRKAG